ncbi:TetR/AcrR family transcriptional regulator [Nonomuraea typhae]|uniref:TetR/AcrR family transcriptional regulator n=1 Tax=Nonomuraea typhae TaxID=2603600 RepID=UPI0012F877D1|nr:TetR/AcrR family transcriptional regulator C-terminal domain-containing protein [Nonomuraea typhae]
MQASVWTRPQKKALSREQIVTAAMRILDTEGLDALSMRRLGTELGAAATSFYRHVASKDELVELVVDEIYGEIEIPHPADPVDWRSAAEGCAHSLRAAILRHPWFVLVFGASGMSYLGPNTMGKTDEMIGILETAGFTLETADKAMSTVVAYVIGVTTSEAATLSLLARTGLSEQEWLEHVWPAAEEAAQPYPRLRRLYAAQRDASAKDDREDQFSFGLRHILASLEATRTA